MSIPGAVPTAGGSKRWSVLAVVCVAYLMLTLDATIMNLALPSAQEDLGFSDANKQWIVTAYALSYGSLLLIGGKLSDLLGRRETFLVGLIGFAAASALGGAADSFTLLVVARTGQGVFAALLAPTALSLLATTFTNPKERAKAFGAFSAVAASGGGVGLLVGGALTSGLNWRWCMYVNLVFTAFCLIVGFRSLEKQPRAKSRLDVLGLVLVSSGLFCLVYGFSNASTHDWGTPSTWGFLVAGAVLLTLFAFWQPRAEAPVLPPRLVLDRNRGGAYLIMLIAGVGLFGMLLFLMYYLQNSLGYSAFKSGLALLPTVTITAVTSTLCNTRLMPRFGPRPLVVIGMTCNAAAMTLLTRIEPDSGYASTILAPIILIGFGMGSVFAAVLPTGTSAVQPQDAGAASATINAGQQLGGAMGTALLNTIAASATADYVSSHGNGTPNQALFEQSMVHGYSQVFWWCTGICLVGAVIGGALLRSGPLPAPAWAPKAEPAAPGKDTVNAQS